jgi:hypothetical protein
VLVTSKDSIVELDTIFVKELLIAISRDIKKRVTHTKENTRKVSCSSHDEMGRVKKRGERKEYKKKEGKKSIKRKKEETGE